MLVGELKTRILEDHSGPVPEGGFFTLAVEVEEKLVQASGAPRDFLHSHIAYHLALSVRVTGVPKELWIFAAAPEAAKRYNLPPILNFGAF